jgi:hypothetical protein
MSDPILTARTHAQPSSQRGLCIGVSDAGRSESTVFSGHNGFAGGESATGREIEAAAEKRSSGAPSSRRFAAAFPQTVAPGDA